MRTLLVLLAFTACKREHADPAHALGSAQTGSAQLASAHDAGAASADAAGAPSGPVNLLAVIPVTMAVSSVVANPKISAYDLVDGNLDTAWNSKTGQLVGAWIAFRMPPSTHVDAVELTVGFVSKGPEGDYFTLNPRIKKVAVWHDGVRLREVELDINARELQKVPIDANGGDYKIEVTAFVPGTKKNWREICVSELRVTGTPAPGTKLGSYSPTFALGSLDASPLVESTLDLTIPDSYASVAEYCESFKKHNPGSACGDPLKQPLAVPALPSGWQAHWFKSQSAGSDLVTCNLGLEARGRVYVLERVGGSDISYKDDSRCGRSIGLGLQGTAWSRNEVSVENVVGSPEPELVLVTTVPDAEKANAWGHDSSEMLWICSNVPSGAPACASTTIGRISNHAGGEGEPGADGLAVWDEYDSAQDYKLAGGALILTRDHVMPDPKAAPERYRLVLPDPD